MNLRSKITWINILTLVVSVLSAITGSLIAEQVVIVNGVVNVLTVILRQLQGKEVTLGGKTITL
jgi:hypothetical protein